MERSSPPLLHRRLRFFHMKRIYSNNAHGMCVGLAHTSRRRISLRISGHRICCASITGLESMHPC